MTDTIHTAMLAIMGEVGFVTKSRTMKGFETYRFAGEAEFIKAIRPAMVEHGVYCYPSAITSHASETYQTSKGTTMNMEKVAMEFTFVHATSGTEIKVAAMGAGADVGDKAVPKMLTGALKYALRQSFLIETGDDPDNTGSDEQGRANLRPPRQFSHNRPPFVPKSSPPPPPPPPLHEEPPSMPKPVAEGPTLRDKLKVPLEWKTELNNAIAERKMTNATVAAMLKITPATVNEFYALAYEAISPFGIAAVLDEIEVKQ